MMTSKKIRIVDYQLGNLYSIVNACKRAGFQAEVSTSADELAECDGIILPGVGAFSRAMASLNSSGLDRALKAIANEGTPIMGVCLGMQLLLSKSHEGGEFDGLDLIQGEVKKLPKECKENTLKVPHLGWNILTPPEGRDWGGSPFSHFGNNDQYMYFVHSYYVDPTDKSCVLSYTNYQGFDFCSAVQKDNIFATQFHPEKSGEVGIGILKQWHSAL